MSRRVAPGENLSRVLLEQLPGVVYLLRADTDDPLAYVSPQCEPVLGLSAEACRTDPDAIARRLHPEDRSRVLAERRRVARGGAPGTIEYRFLRPDGRVVWLRDQADDLLDQSGVRYVQGLVIDVTAEKEMEAERDRMEAELRLSHRLDAVGQLAAGIAHEINTPIQFVGDTVQFLEDAFGDLLALVAAYEAGDPAAVAAAAQHADLDYVRERVPAAFTRASDGLDRVATIVRAMREFSHPSGETAPVDLNAAVESTLVVARNEYKYVADLETDLGELPQVECNVGDVNQVVINLVVNAADAIRDVVGDSGERGTIRVRTCIEGDDAVVSVADSGSGIEPRNAGRVFDPFFTTKEVGRGTGQGLAIARAIAERHDGTLAFEPRPGGGTVFSLRLPLAREAVAA